MATADDCRQALAAVAVRLAAVDPDVRRRHAVDRTVSLRLYDLGVIFAGRLRDGELVDVVEEGDGPRAQLRMSCSSDDLLALTAGTLRPGSAWTSGRLRIEASPLDLLRLRSLL